MQKSPTAHLVPLLICFFVASCCKRDLQAQYRSPSGKHVLAIIRADCAAFSSHTEIRLGPTADTGEVVASISHSPVVQVTWIRDDLVQVFVPDGYTRNLRKAESDGIHIEFR